MPHSSPSKKRNPAQHLHVEPVHLEIPEGSSLAQILEKHADSEDAAREMFARYDTNQNATIERIEMLGLMGERVLISGATAELRSAAPRSAPHRSACNNACCGGC